MYTEKLVSIVIPTKNRAHLLERALKSAINQTYKNIEIIVVDDCSKDNTAEVVAKYINLDSRIKFIKNEMEGGANLSRNNGILYASGYFIAGLDDDDEFVSNRVEILLQNYNPEYSLITSLNTISNNGILSNSSCPEIVNLDMILDFNVLMNQALYEKSRALSIGMYDVGLKAYQDYDFWVRMILKYGSAKVIQEYLQLVHFDSDRNRITTNHKDQFSGYFNWYKKFRTILTTFQKKNHLSHFYRVRQKQISKKVFSTLVTPHNIEYLMPLLSSFQEYKYKIFQQIDNKINHLKNLDKIIIYGYGSLGKYIFSILKENTIAIVDKNLSVSNISGVPVVNLEELKNYEGSNIIITPIPYIDEIKLEINSYDLNVIKIMT